MDAELDFDALAEAAYNAYGDFVDLYPDFRGETLIWAWEVCDQSIKDAWIAAVKVAIDQYEQRDLNRPGAS